MGNEKCPVYLRISANSVICDSFLILTFFLGDLSKIKEKPWVKENFTDLAIFRFLNERLNISYLSFGFQKINKVFTFFKNIFLFNFFLVTILSVCVCVLCASYPLGLNK